MANYAHIATRPSSEQTQNATKILPSSNQLTYRRRINRVCATGLALTLAMIGGSTLVPGSKLSAYSLADQLALDGLVSRTLVQGER